MVKEMVIRPDEKEFFLVLKEAAFINPFSPKRQELHRKIVGTKEFPRDYPWPGNVRELEQAIRRILLTNSYHGDVSHIPTGLKDRLHHGIDEGTLNAQEILVAYCTLLYQRCGTYEEVARKTKLDRRTVKKYIQITSDVKPICVK